MLPGLESLKDQLILIILIFHSLFPIRDRWESRKQIFEELKKNHHMMINSGESESNLEEIIIDLFFNDVLAENPDPSLRVEFQKYRHFKERDDLVSQRSQ
jgi:hypothetical protein